MNKKNNIRSSQAKEEFRPNPSMEEHDDGLLDGNLYGSAHGLGSADQLKQYNKRRHVELSAEARLTELGVERSRTELP